MSEQYFDQKLRTALEGLELPYEASTWDLLQQRMHVAVAEETPSPVDTVDKSVDKAVHHALERLEAPYQAGHWDLLAQRLQVQAIRLRRLRVAKVAEAAILLLLLANLGIFLGPSYQFHPFQWKKQRPNVPVAAAEGHPKRGMSKRIAAHPASSDAAQAALVQVLQAPGAPDLLSPEQALTASDVPAVLGELQHIAEAAQQRLFASTADPLPYDGLSAVVADSRLLALPHPTVQENKAGSPFYLGAFASADQNHVLVGGQNRIAGGYGAGVTAGFRRGKWGIETGISYHQSQFTPQKELELYGANDKGYKGSYMASVNADLVSVPFKVTRQLARVGRTRVQAVAGLTGHLAVQKAYQYKTAYFTGQPPSSLPSSNSDPKLQQEGRGVLENGSLSGNFYATADAGLRIEYPISGGRYMAFVEPSYRQSLTGKGIGPKRERMNTVAVQAGVMAFL